MHISGSPIDSKLVYSTGISILTNIQGILMKGVLNYSSSYLKKNQPRTY